MTATRPGMIAGGLNREAHYYLALSLVRMGRPLEAEQLIIKAEKLTREMDPGSETAFTSLSLLSGMINDSKGNSLDSRQLLDKISSMKNFQNSHQEAERLKVERYKP
ncbi:MAG: hypothetical protein IPL67_19465 [Ignavibacteria bacterium]|nr:hypothetical protein [Ignavibacteria bacterium]